MKTRTRIFLSRTMYSLLIGTCLSLLSVADATASPAYYRPPPVHRDYVVSQPLSFPRWLHGDSKFQSWYAGNRYRMQRNASWQHIYDTYSIEKRYRSRNRPHDRKFRGRVKYDHGYPTYRAGPGKRRH